jgi:uncharacterized phage protein (TIGR01671 family)
MVMRVILFRGKRIDNGMWIEGCLRQYLNGHAGICCNKIQHLFRVDSDTVGQYTGLKDKNGKRIFEGDIIKMSDEEVGAVVYRNDCAGYELTCSGCAFCLSQENERLVIGNIHDNPELLKEE